MRLELPLRERKNFIMNCIVLSNFQLKKQTRSPGLSSYRPLGRGNDVAQTVAFFFKSQPILTNFANFSLDIIHYTLMIKKNKSV